MSKFNKFLDQDVEADDYETLIPHRPKAERAKYLSENPHQVRKASERKQAFQKVSFAPLMVEELGPLRDAQIGSRILFKDDRDEKLRPGIVYALWRNEGSIKKIEVLPSTRDLNNIFPSDFVFKNEELKSKFRSEQSGRIMTRTVLVIDNTRKFLPAEKNQIDERIDDSLWPELLVRRVQALVYSPATPSVTTSPIQKGLVREGFAFGNLSLSNVMSGVWTPDIISSQNEEGLGRTPSSLLEQTIVDTLAHYAVSFHAAQRKGSVYSFPPLDEWEDISPAKFPVWDKRPSKKAKPSP